MGFEATKVVGQSFAVILMISLSAFVAHSRLHNVDYRLGLILGLGRVINAQIGARLVELVSRVIFQRIFAVIVLLIAVRIFFQK